METVTDVAIIGAGPIGIELAVALKKAGIAYVHLEAQQIGYTISWFAPGTRFFSSNERIAIAGVPLQTVNQGKATREEYLAYLRGVVQQFDLAINTYEPVVKIARVDDGFVLATAPLAGPRNYRAQRVVLTTGGTAKPRLLNIPGEELPHVSHYFRDPHIYFGKRVLIVGGRNSAIEAAIRCYQMGARVALSFRGEKLDPRHIKYWLLPEAESLLKAGRIQHYFGTVPVKITPAAATVKLADGRTEEVPADFVLLLVGYEADMTLAEMAGVELQNPGQKPVFNLQTMETSLPGLYAAGTCIAGTQERYRVFIENAHVHVDRIVAALLGKPPPEAVPSFAMPES